MNQRLVMVAACSVWAAAAWAAEPGPVSPLDRDLCIARARIVGPWLRPPDPGQVRALLDSLRPDGSWPSVDYQSQHRSGWGTARHLSHVLSLARAYVAPESPLRGDAQLKKGVSASLDYWLLHDFQNPNWWHNRIGVPGSMSRILLLWDENLTPLQRKKGIEILGRADLSMTGQNLVWLAEIVASRGILQRDPDLVAAAYRRIADEIRVTTEEGIQPDYSFHQHGPCLYSHGYGAGFASDCAEMAVWLADTRFAFAPEKIDLLSRLILDGHQWLARGSTPDYGAIGRQTARPRQSVGYLANVARHMLQLPTGREREFDALARRAAGEPAPPLVGNRHFWRSDTMAHHRPDYYTSARMYSRRIVNTDGPSNGEGLRNHHLADGCNLILRTGREYEDIFPVWDWERVPGTTVELTGDFGGSPRRRGETDFVGGVSDGTYGLAAFDFRRGKLRARKSWFFFDDQYVCLGAGIVCDSANPVITTVNQCRLAGDVTVSVGGRAEKLARGTRLLAAPAWAHHDQVAYFFLQAVALQVRAGPQSGSWHLIAAEQPDRPITEEVFSLWVDHGTSPAGARYAYVVAPGMPLAAVGSAAASRDVEILRNDPELQAARHRLLQLTGAAFYQPGRLKVTDKLAIGVDQPCLVLLRETPGQFAVSVSNPRNQPLRVAVELAASDSTLRTPFDLPGGMDAGKSVTRGIEIRQRDGTASGK